MASEAVAGAVLDVLLGEVRALGVAWGLGSRGGGVVSYGGAYCEQLCYAENDSWFLRVDVDGSSVLLRLVLTQAGRRNYEHHGSRFWRGDLGDAGFLPFVAGKVLEVVRGV